MSHKNSATYGARIVALSVAIALSSVAAFAQSADRSDYYASIGNPHPELPGFPKIKRSDNKIYANIFDPRPEITMPSAGVFATTGHGAPYQTGKSQTAAAPPQTK
jgi:hypothetical protein